MFIRSASEGFLQFMNNATTCALQKPSTMKVTKKRKAEVIELADDDSESEMTDIENHVEDDDLGASLAQAFGMAKRTRLQHDTMGDVDSDVSHQRPLGGPKLADTNV